MTAYGSCFRFNRFIAEQQAEAGDSPRKDTECQQVSLSVRQA